MKYAITGANGHFGQAAVNHLRQSMAQDDQIIALARNTEKANDLFKDFSQVEVRPGSYADKAALVKSLQDVDRLLFISSQPNADFPRLEQHANLIAAAKTAGIKYLVYTSFPQADQADNFLASDHQATEGMIKDAGIPHAFARNNWYLENETTMIQAALDQGSFVYAAGSGKVGWALESDYAAGAADLLINAPAQTIFEFAGPQHDYADLAKAIAAVTGQPVDAQLVSDADYRADLLAKGTPEAQVAFSAQLQALIRRGDLSFESDDLAHVLGRQPVSLLDGVKEIIASLH